MFSGSDLKIQKNISLKCHGPFCIVKLLYAVYCPKMSFNIKPDHNLVFPCLGTVMLLWSDN